MAVQVEHNMRRSVLVDVLTVHGAAGKSIIFTQTKRDADEVAAGVALVMPCEVGPEAPPPPPVSLLDASLPAKVILQAV